MNKKIKYTDEPIGEVRLVADFLPSPEELKLKSENTKVTISLSSESVAYFKQAAKTNHMQYQKMIRELLDEYVAHQKMLTSSTNGLRNIGDFAAKTRSKVANITTPLC